jgi:hypothetical protein
MSIAPAEPPPPSDAMCAQLAGAYAALAKLQLKMTERDFWRMRAAKQHAQVQADALLHEHTSIQQYLAWHAPDGSRLPAFLRIGALSLKGLAQPAQAQAQSQALTW